MMMSKKQLETRCISSLAKKFPDEEIKERPFTKASAFLNEVYSFQIAYKSNDKDLNRLIVNIESNLQSVIEVRKVGLVPSDFPIYDDHDENILRNKPGLYPDPLYPLDGHRLDVVFGEWHAIWVTVHLNENVSSGQHEVRLRFESEAGGQLAEEQFTLEVLPVKLPEQELICTHWFHADCLATQYEVDVFSEQHWQLIAQYVETAVKHGMNMLLTPLFTPPLDTDFGGERPTVQLVDVVKNKDSYTFNFDRLDRWVQMAYRHGVKYFEFSHLFTQWGAYHAPKVIAMEDGKAKKLFGWETDAHGREYRHFLSQFLPSLIDFIKQNGLKDAVYFHVSDEPNADTFQSYRKASEFMHQYVSDYPVIDALSDYPYYEQGIVKRPIPANDHIEPFLQHQVPDLWTYYCCAQYKKVSNRFFNFPSARNRITGIQLYKFNIAGFLHWGYNFWYSRLSKKAINPFKNTDADKGFPSGDAFLVYPGENGPIESIRLEVFYDALQDLRALKLLTELIGQQKVIDLLEEDLDEAITFSEYPCESDWLLNKREAINHAIVEAIQNQKQ